MKRIAIFASGTGSNARKIIEYFQGHEEIEVALVISNKAHAAVLSMAAAHSLSTLVIDRSSFYETDRLLEELRSFHIDLLVLAGFLWLIPSYLIDAYPAGIINIHPALLPKYGGKGMYGMNVHRAVKEAGESESGMTIHYVDPRYDEGKIIFQAKCSLSSEDTAEEIASKVLQLEHQHYAQVIEQLLRKGIRS